MIDGIDHIQLAIPKGGEDKARAFWAGKMGFVEVEKPPALQQNAGGWFRLGAVELHVGVQDAFHPAKKAHPAFRTTRLDELAQLLQPDMIKTDLPDRRRFFIEDPFGNRLEFVEYLQNTRA